MIKAAALALLGAVLAQAALAGGSRFAPLDGRILVLAGQTVRDTRDYLRLPNTPTPAGYSDYISYSVGTLYPENAPDAGAVHAGNNGLLAPTNWGAGIQCVACLLREPGLEQGVINIGMYLGGPEYEDRPICSGRPECNLARIARGEFDHQLGEFADWLNGLDGRPVLLRAGYEFDGDWNGYDPAQFVAAWKHMHRLLRARGVRNVAWVLHSYGYASLETLEDYFPQPDALGERYVDWIGYSHFTSDPATVGRNEIAFARDKGLKVFIGELAPHGGESCENQIDIARDPGRALAWLENFKRHIAEHRDVIGAIAYINSDWSDHDYAPMWKAQDDQNCRGFFYRSNSRLNDSPRLERAWADYVGGADFLNATPGLRRRLRD